MNKQEVIEELEYLKRLLEKGSKDNYNSGFINALTYALNVTNELDESEKPVVPQFVAEWLEVCKENLGFSLSSAMSHYTSAMKAQPKKVQGWFNLKSNQETFAKAWLFGYEVKKEKLYTVSFKKSGIGIGVQQQDGSFKERFAKEELKEYGFDNLDVYEVDEVKNETKI
ncbi:hypothetical protein Si129_00804 [Streptococcus infantarius subsp. infantarius]|uniref:DUF1642 domain-containing protein n=1 Tax=Streptococcus infantarius TaxID=102684 RepID=UPI00208F559E|nr:DUF1642 domain-containing protein [Streptococcus infantarius]MCO4480122.1 hypothetical protein [Streptococcus infantarius subsp. infantarius]MCO4506376.1 hypothetical protein [Streptococcus infantarius subsp. infantarius]MCY7237915.1 DUF1642 domain-containing protein [Streptococcus infantarius]